MRLARQGKRCKVEPFVAMGMFLYHLEMETTTLANFTIPLPRKPSDKAVFVLLSVPCAAKRYQMN